MLPTLWSWAPSRVLLLGVFRANRMTPRLVQKQRKALFFDLRMEEGNLVLYRTQSPLKGHGRGCFMGISGGRGRGWSSRGRAQLYCSGLRSQPRQRLCARPPPSWIEVLCAALLRTVPELRCRRRYFPGGAVVWRAGCEVSACGPLWARETRLCTKGKKRLDFIILPEFYFYFLRIVSGLCWWQIHRCSCC